jgi:hypothetical protein
LNPFDLVSITGVDGLSMVFNGQCRRFIFRFTSFVATFSSVKGQRGWQMQPRKLKWTTRPFRETGPLAAKSLLFFTASCLFSFFFLMLFSSSFSTFLTLVKASSTFGTAGWEGISIIVGGEMGYPEVHQATLSGPNCVADSDIKEQKESHNGRKNFNFTRVKSYGLDRHDGIEFRG